MAGAIILVQPALGAVLVDRFGGALNKLRLRLPLLLEHDGSFPRAVVPARDGDVVEVLARQFDHALSTIGILRLDL